MSKNKLEKLEEGIGYSFRDKSLLIQALSHSSYANEHRSYGHGDNERLEFLGDAVLEVICSNYLYLEYSQMREGELTKLRSSIVCEPTLAMCARTFGLQDYLFLGRGEESTGGRGRDSVISDALEALIGAIYLDGGIKNASMFVSRFILTDIEHRKLFRDSKTILQEIAQRDFRDSNVVYTVIAEDGPDHGKSFTVSVSIGEECLGEGQGSSKKSAEQEAAYMALVKLKKSGRTI